MRSTTPAQPSKHASPEPDVRPQVPCAHRGGPARPVPHASKRKRGDHMAIDAYVLIQTEVGKAAPRSADSVRAIAGSSAADDVTGPYDVIVRTEATEPRRPREAGGLARSRPSRGSPGRSHLPGREPVASSRLSDSGTAGPPLVHCRASARSMRRSGEPRSTDTPDFAAPTSGTSRSA